MTIIVGAIFVPRIFSCQSSGKRPMIDGYSQTCEIAGSGFLRVGRLCLRSFKTYRDFWHNANGTVIALIMK
jgi:hypothetical protein